MPDYDFRHFGIQSSPTANASIKIQQALDDMWADWLDAGGAKIGNQTGVLTANAGNYVLETHVQPRQGTTVIGSGTGNHGGGMGTRFFIPNGNGADGQGDHGFYIPFTASPNFVHWTKLAHFLIYKENALDVMNLTQDPVGHGIWVDERVAENFRISNVYVYGMAQDGVRLSRGGTPGWIDHLHVFNNQGYGLNITKGLGDRWHNFHAAHISGDNNGRPELDAQGDPLPDVDSTTALIKVGTVGTFEERITLSYLKSESSVQGRQQNVVYMEDVVTNVWIEHVSGLVFGTSTGAATVKVDNPTQFDHHWVTMIDAHTQHPLHFHDVNRDYQQPSHQGRWLYIYNGDHVLVDWRGGRVAFGSLGATKLEAGHYAGRIVKRWPVKDEATGATYYVPLYDVITPDPQG